MARRASQQQPGRRYIVVVGLDGGLNELSIDVMRDDDVVWPEEASLAAAAETDLGQYYGYNLGCLCKVNKQSIISLPGNKRKRPDSLMKVTDLTCRIYAN